MSDPTSWAVAVLESVDAFTDRLPCPAGRDPRSHVANVARLREDVAHALRSFVVRLGQYPEAPRPKVE